MFGSIFPGPGSAAANPTEAVWLLVNRAKKNYSSGPQLTNLAIPGDKLKRGELALFDCWRGAALDTYTVDKDGSVTLSFAIESEGFGCVLLTANATTAGTRLADFLSTMAAMTRTGPLKSFDPIIRKLQYTMIRSPRVSSLAGPAAAVAHSDASLAGGDVTGKPPAGMALVPTAVPYFDYSVSAKEDQSLDMQYYWEAGPSQVHATVRIPVRGFYMDETPVSGGQYDTFLRSSRFWPTDTYNFLKNWGAAKTCPAALADRAVTYVSQAEARKYCAYEGKRLPTEWEWQYAAQGANNSKYPWGNQNASACSKAAKGAPCQPDKVIGNNIPAQPPVVGAHSPQGDSPFGLKDMVGTVCLPGRESLRAVLCLRQANGNHRPEETTATQLRSVCGQLVHKLVPSSNR